MTQTTDSAAVPAVDAGNAGCSPESGAFLTERQRVSLQAVCRRIAPVAFEPGGPQEGLPAAVEERLADTRPALAKQIAVLLTAFDHPAARFATSGQWLRFSELSAEEQDRWLAEWERSRLGPRRTVFQALRRLVLSVYYTFPSAQERIGYLGPLHTREPQVPWEGPMLDDGNSSEQEKAEPVARVSSKEEVLAKLGLPDESPGGPSGVLEGVTQGHELGAETTLKCGACVVGTGAGGAVAAARLAEAGHDVIVLEEGGYYTARDFTEEEGEMTSRLYADGGLRATDDLSFAVFQGRSVGGSTTINWMISLRTWDWVLQEWEREHGAYGMGPKEMSPVFDRVEEEIHARRVPDDAHSPNNRIILDGARKLGWSARAENITAKGCVRSGFCGLGCRYGAKQSTQATYIPKALSAGARLYSDTRVDLIEKVENGGRAPLKRLRCSVLDRETGRTRGSLVVEAPVVVLGAGAVGTPTILQRSGMGGGGVGKYLRLHPTTATLGEYGRKMYAAGGIPLSALCDEFLVNSESGYGSWIECPPPHASLSAITVPGFGEEHRRYMEKFPNSGALITLVRDGADKRMSNGKVSADRKGRPHIKYRLGPSDRENLITGVEAAVKLHLAEGAEAVMTQHGGAGCRIGSERELGKVRQQKYGANRLGMFSAHVNGTCRMGTNPATSGCTPDGEVHGTPGLYVADGSLLPTGVGVNPQETIMAVSTVISERIAERHASAKESV